MFESIVTHPGSAHKDEFLACCVLLTQASVVIDRREPTEADLTNSAIAVVDIGEEHLATLNNFDHHQFPHDHVPTCALSLVLQHLGLYEDARKFCSWLETTEWIDCRGPMQTAQWLGIERNPLAKLNSPIEMSVLRRFASQDEHKPGEPVWEFMHMIGQDIIEYITGMRQRLDYIAKHAEIWQIEDFKVLFMPRIDPVPEEPSTGIGHYIEQQELKDEIIATIYPDRRGHGYGLSRFNDNLHLDFTKLKDERDVHFTHTRGFVAKTSATDTKRLRSMLKQAYQG